MSFKDCLFSPCQFPGAHSLSKTQNPRRRCPCMGGTLSLGSPGAASLPSRSDPCRITRPTSFCLENHLPVTLEAVTMEIKWLISPNLPKHRRGPAASLRLVVKEGKRGVTVKGTGQKGWDVLGVVSVLCAWCPSRSSRTGRGGTDRLSWKGPSAWPPLLVLATLDTCRPPWSPGEAAFLSPAGQP